jgi:hypothetical protein
VVPIFEKWFGSMGTAGPLIGAVPDQLLPVSDVAVGSGQARRARTLGSLLSRMVGVPLISLVSGIYGFRVPVSRPFGSETTPSGIAPPAAVQPRDGAD